MRKTKKLAAILFSVVLIALTGCENEKKKTSDTEADIPSLVVDEETNEIISDNQNLSDTASDEASDEPSDAEGDYFSIKIEDIYSFKEGTYVTGTIESGTVRTNDQVQVMNDEDIFVGTVKKIDILGEVVEEATVNEYVGLLLDKIDRSNLTVGAYLTTPSKEALMPPSVLHPRKYKDLKEYDFEYAINIKKGEYIETEFCTIDNIELVMGPEFGDNKIHVEEAKFESSMLAGLKATLTNTSDESYYPGNCYASAYSYNIEKFDPHLGARSVLYVVKDGDLLENVEVASGETVEIYILGEIDYNWHQRYADTFFVSLGMQKDFEPKDANSSYAYDYSFEIGEMNRHE